MKIKIYGAKGPWCQVNRIADGFRSFGHEIVSEDKADIIYVNNPPFDKGDEEHDTPPIECEGFKIFNVLDIPEHIPDYDTGSLREQLLKADAVTCISDAVKHQLERRIDVPSTVILNPVKEVFVDAYINEKDIDFLYVGRANDPNKRFNLLSDLENIVVVGNEFPKFGSFVGEVCDSQLNAFYNRSKFLLLPSRFEGLGLTAIEAIIAGAVPIVCMDNPNSGWCPDFCRSHPSKFGISETINRINERYTYYRDFLLRGLSPEFQRLFSKFAIAENIITLYKKCQY